MRILNIILASICMVLLFVTGMGWLLDQFGFWEKDTKFQQWICDYAFPTTD